VDGLTSDRRTIGQMGLTEQSSSEVLVGGWLRFGTDAY